MFRLLVLVTSLLATPLPVARTQGPAHHIAFVKVRPDVGLEVLDWGGHGPALVFLAGFGNSGHVFDTFAPQFANQFHVIAITRRGFGASSHPGAGYDTGTLVRDITSVLDSLEIPRATFVGHSFAGTELSSLGAFHADRVTQLIYLDSSYDFARLFADPRWQRAFPVPRPPVPATTDIGALRHWFDLVMGPGLPDDEIQVLTSSGGSDSLGALLQRGAAASAFNLIKGPVLALWATPMSVSDQYPYSRRLDSLEQSRLQDSFHDQETVRAFVASR